MSMEPIVESGMTFGPYPEGFCFYIEKSVTYQRLGDGVKMAEFLLLRQNGKSPTVWIIEAKSSSPRPETQPNFDEFISEIRDKLINGLTLGVATCLERHQTAELELPELFKKLSLKAVDFKLILVIKGHKDDWLQPLNDELRKQLNSTIKTWGLSPNAVAAINDTMARQHGLIQ